MLHSYFLKHQLSQTLWFFDCLSDSQGFSQKGVHWCVLCSQSFQSEIPQIFLSPLGVQYNIIANCVCCCLCENLFIDKLCFAFLVAEAKMRVSSGAWHVVNWQPCCNKLSYWSGVHSVCLPVFQKYPHLDDDTRQTRLIKLILLN